MSQSVNIVTNSLEYYDKNREKYDKIMSQIKYYKWIKVTSDLDHSKIIFYDKNKKKLFESRYEAIGLYSNTSRTWIWAWSVPYFQKNVTYISRKILNYGLDIPSKKENRFLKSELVTSRFRVWDDVQLDVHISVASYISKNPLVIDLIITDDADLELYEVKKDVENQEFYKVYLFLLDHDKI